MTVSSSAPRLAPHNGTSRSALGGEHELYQPSSAWPNRSQTGITPSMRGVISAMETLTTAGALPRDCAQQLERMRRVAKIVAHKQGQHLQRTYSASAPLVAGSRATSSAYYLVAPPSRAPPRLRPKGEMRRTNSIDELAQMWLGPTRGEGLRRSDSVSNVRVRSYKQ